MSALADAAGALLALAMALDIDSGASPALVGFCHRRALNALLAIQAEGVTERWLAVALADITDPALRCLVRMETVDAIGQVLLAEAAAELAATGEASSLGRHETHPPPSDEGNDEVLERDAALAATGDTLPPESGDVPLGWMAVCTGSDTEPCPAGGWDDAATYVP